MNRRPLEPLDAEERALADQLARLGPRGEPAPKLDARILAAAHDAVAGRPAEVRGHRPRWPLGVGVAASVMLAVAVAWQLRPMHDGPEPLAEAASDSAAMPAAEVAQPAAPPVGPPVVRFESRPPPPPPPAMARVENPPSADAAATTATSPAPPARKPAATQHRVAKTAPAERVARAPGSGTVSNEAVELSAAKAPVRATDATLDRFDVDYAAVPAPPAPAPPAAAARDESATFGYVADPETTAAVALRREQARAEHARNAAEAAEAAEKAEVRHRASQTSAALQDALPSLAGVGIVGGNAAPAPKRTPIQAVASSAGTTRNALKRTDLQLPVAEDTKLEADAWLERIRLRRDLGDRASATDSLLRFKQQHPFQKVPEDLKELLGE